jgi:hypothetical protein
MQTPSQLRKIPSGAPSGAGVEKISLESRGGPLTSGSPLFLFSNSIGWMQNLTAERMPPIEE